MIVVRLPTCLLYLPMGAQLKRMTWSCSSISAPSWLRRRDPLLKTKAQLPRPMNDGIVVSCRVCARVCVRSTAFAQESARASSRGRPRQRE